MFFRLGNTIFFAVIVALLVSASGVAQTGGLEIFPGRLEVEVWPGHERTVAFQIASPPSESAVRGRLLLSVTDWNLNEDATTFYSDPGTQPNSASGWIVFSPTAITITSGESHQVRVTVRVPASVEPGVYRTAIFVQERPPAVPPRPGQHVVYFRFRYVFTLYVIVPPVEGRGELVDVRLGTDRHGYHLVYEVKNRGSRHLRPYVSWTIRDAKQNEISVVRREETTVLLPFSKLRELFFISEILAPGRYEVAAQVDFLDGGPVQVAKRTVEIPTASAQTARTKLETASLQNR